MSVNKLVGKLVGKYSGPVLVVGGAPGALEELAFLRANGFDFKKCKIISANEHAVHAGLKPHYACVNDDVHQMLQEPQEPRLRKLMPKAKLLSRHWWADYRNPQLMACNSGLKAMLYAAIMGANPVVVVGIQNYSDGLYFHPAEGKKSNPNMARGSSYFTKLTTALKKALTGVPVRTVTGPLTHLWPKWDPKEVFEPRAQSPLERKAAEDAADTRYVCAMSESTVFESALVPQNTVFAVTKAELLHFGRSTDVVDATGWDLSDTNAVLAEAQARGRAERTRLQELIRKLRSSRRNIRRTIYDADIVRVIRWVEEGHSMEAVAHRAGLPKEQIKFMAETMGLTAA